MREEKYSSKAILSAVETIEGGNMANQFDPEPAKRSKVAPSNPTPWIRDPHATHLKKAVRSVEVDVSYLCTAFLAERGCLSPEKPKKYTAA